MKKFFTGPRLRALTALVFFLLFLLGLAVHTGWGTASSFGIAEIAAICPLGGLEAMLASKTFLPRALVGFAVFLVVAVLLGRFFCGWLCPVPWVEKALSKLRAPGRRFGLGLKESPAASETPRSSACTTTNASSNTASESGKNAPRSCPSGASCASSSCKDCALASRVKEKADQATEKTPYWILGGALASSAVFGFPVFCLICPVGLTFALTVALWRLFEFNETNWAILWFAGFLVLELLVLRRWCSRFCPLGALWTLASRLNRFFRPKAREDLCTRMTHGVPCTICRDVCPEGIDPASVANDPMLLARCTKCGACAAACPTGAVHFPFLADSGKKTVPIVSVAKTSASLKANTEVPASSDEGLNAALTPEEERMEVARCIHCGACGERCPLGDRMPRATALLARGRREEAAEVLLSPGGFPEITSRVCPTERFCEGACAAEHEGQPVAVARLERTLADEALRAGWQPDVRHAAKRRRVAVVGSGPAGLACADVLVRLGVEVHVIDRAPVAGGLLSLGIPSFKLPRDVVANRVKLLEDAGVRFALGLSVGRDLSWRDLANEFDAVFAGTGATRPVTLDVPGARREDGQDDAFLLTADVFLRAVAKREANLPDAGTIPDALNDLQGRRVAVLGGGDTALDCARTALRLGSTSVTLVARRTKETLRARPSDLAQAEREGVTLLCGRTVSAVLRKADGSLEGLSLSVAADGETPSETLSSDVVIVAYGFRCVPDEELRTLGVVYDETGRIRTDAEGRTNAPKLWAGGDAVRGPALVSWALADGRRAGLSIASAIGVLR